MKDYVISHIKDVDGVTPIILMNLTSRNFDYQLLDIYEVEAFMQEFLTRDLSKYEHIYITDLTVPESIYQQLEHHPMKDKFLVFDHHKSHMYASSLSFVTLDMEECGTTLFYRYLKSLYNIETPALNQYIPSVKHLDLWTFEEHQDTLAPTLGLLFDLYGEERYIREMTERFKVVKEEFVLTVFEKELLALEKTTQDHYINQRELRMKKVNFDGVLAGIVFAEKYRSELGNTLLQRHPELEFVIIINMNGGISLRSRGYDVSEVASKFGGGGHRQASGMSVDSAALEDFIIKQFKGSVTFED